MKIVIKQTKYCDTNEQIFKDYPILKKYKEKMDYYTGYNNGSNKDYDSNKYYDNNSIVIDMNDNEIFETLKELAKESELVIGYAEQYNKENYDVDFFIEIYDYYRE